MKAGVDMRFGELRSPEDIIELVEAVGFLPFFKNHIPGFSIEENCPGELWFSDEAEGPWEWKGPAARSGRCVYGKFFSGKAGFVSREWFPAFANYRRDGYDFDARFEDGLAPIKDRGVYEAVAARGAVLSKELKDVLNYKKGGNRGFDTVITRLQMQTYVVISDFVYMKDRHGKTYGWGVAKYSTPEELFGYDHVAAGYDTDPKMSGELVEEKIKKSLPDVPAGMVRKLIKI